ncbi:hypothetical protein WA026_018523 [Henosepilachna vigintioctopunctata]|uniref:Chemosensory protein n=1 Tax=Henosepilachna vigintioctopunctata TaxID=420089 RepID=A0AAW1U973_9CUCU
MLWLLLIGIAFLINVNAEEKYTSQYDNIDVKRIIGNERLLDAYVKCLIDGERCTPDANELRKILPEAIKTGCEKCTRTHIEKTKQIVDVLMREKPEIWNKLVAKFDPDHIYSEKFKDRLKKEGFNV